MLVSTLYVSHSTIAPAHAEAAVEELVATSIANNRRQDITGVLLFTGTHFAQILEGPKDAVEALMASIALDARHDKPMTVSRTVVRERRFENWALAYHGPSLFVARHVARLLSSRPGTDRQRADRWLTDMMLEFATA